MVAVAVLIMMMMVVNSHEAHAAVTYVTRFRGGEGAPYIRYTRSQAEREHRYTRYIRLQAEREHQRQLEETVAEWQGKVAAAEEEVRLAFITAGQTEQEEKLAALMEEVRNGSNSRVTYETLKAPMRAVRGFRHQPSPPITAHHCPSPPTTAHHRPPPRDRPSPPFTFCFRPFQEKKARVAHLQQKALRRVQQQGVLGCWGSWAEYAYEARRKVTVAAYESAHSHCGRSGETMRVLLR